MYLESFRVNDVVEAGSGLLTSMLYFIKTQPPLSLF